MTWAAIIAMIVQFLGPLVAKWIQSWIERRLEVAAQGLGSPATFGVAGPDDPPPVAVVTALMDRAVEQCRSRFRRALLMRARGIVIDRFSTGSVTPAAIEEFKLQAELVDEREQRVLDL